MSISVLKTLSIVVLFAACTSSSRNTSQAINYPADNLHDEQPFIDSNQKLQSLIELPQSQYGGFVLAPGYYEAEFKTYCLQPGTPDPKPRDAYLQGPVSGYRKEIVESVLLNSRNNPGIDQRNIQLLLWSAVSGSDFNKLSPAVQSDAMKLLTPKQIFELKGGVIGLIKTVSSATGILSSNSDMRRLFDAGISSYESYEKLAVLNEATKIKRTGVKADQWYKQSENYYVRYFPVSYKKVRVQVYVPQGLLDAEGRRNGEYIVFDPTGQQAMPAYTNAQRLGVGAPIGEIVRVIIQVSKKPNGPKQPAEQKKPVERPKRESPKAKQFLNS
jgi:hypothetical protein